MFQLLRANLYQIIIVFELGPGALKTQLKFLGHPPAALREYNNFSRFKDYTPGELLEFHLDELNKLVLRYTNINAKRLDLPIVTVSEQYTVLHLWLCHGLVHTASQCTMLNTNSKYAEAGFAFPDFSDRLSPERYKEIMSCLRFEDYDDPTVDRSHKSWKVGRMVATTRKVFHSILMYPGQHWSLD